MSRRTATLSHRDHPLAGIAFIIVAMTLISINDAIIKLLADEYPLHEMVLVRSTVALGFSLILLQFEGGFQLLKTRTPWQHMLRGLLVVISNLAFFSGLASLPLGEATALFFVAPLFITLLSIPLLGEHVGRLRLAAVAAGFVGVLIMVRPWAGTETRDLPIFVHLLPVVAAAAYACFQIMTRRLGPTTKASALAVYIQGVFIVVSLGIFLIAGDGRFADGVENESIQMLLRPWIWPRGDDVYLFLVLGLISAGMGYTIAQAYRLAQAGTLAPFEYTGLPLALLWSWLIWHELPDPTEWLGITLILGAGLFVYVRERIQHRRQFSVAPDLPHK